MAETLGEARALRQQILRMRDEAKQNESRFKRSQQRELDILSAANLHSLFDTLTVGLAASYEVDAATLVLLDPDHTIRHLMIAEGGRLRRPETLHFCDALAGLTPQHSRLSRPWMGPYHPADHGAVMVGKNIASLAMIPLCRKKSLIGSINLGSRDPDRYRKTLASDFLAHLGLIASFAIENAVNRARLLRSGFTDVLTGWHNRRYLKIRLEEELSRARRQGDGVSCLFMDLDHFKSVNDPYGHHAGDLVLAECARRIDAEVRTSDVAARYGGEEFVIIAPGASLAVAEKLARRILNAVSRAPVALESGESLDVSVSIGVAYMPAPTNGDDHKSLGEQLLKRADLAMYAAKSAGRNCVRSAD